MEEIINEEYEIFLEDMDKGITFDRFLITELITMRMNIPTMKLLKQ